MTRMIIIGAGGFGREVAWIVERINAACPTFEVLGFCDDAEDKREGMCGKYPLLGPVESAKNRFGPLGFICAIGNNRARKTAMAGAQAMGFDPVTIVDPSALIAPGSEIGLGSYVGIGSIVSVGSRIGNGVLINHRVCVGHDVTVDDYAQLCPGVSVSGGSAIGEGALLGTGAGTIPLRRVGAWATVVAGTMALRDVADGATWIRTGSPLKP